MSLLPRYAAIIDKSVFVRTPLSSLAPECSPLKYWPEISFSSHVANLVSICCSVLEDANPLQQIRQSQQMVYICLAVILIRDDRNNLTFFVELHSVNTNLTMPSTITFYIFLVDAVVDYVPFVLAVNLKY